jgi:hypothetical protein
MVIVREVMFCKPGKVKTLTEKFLAMSKIMEKMGQGKMRVMTDIATDRYWTLVAEMEAPSLEAFEKMMVGAGMTPELEKEFGKIMEGYHDLVDQGRREIYKLEG